MKLKKNNGLFVLVVLAALLIMPSSALASPISGQFGIGGSATVTAVSLNFFCLVVCPAGSGDFTVSPITTTGSFAGLGATTGVIKNISETGGQPLNTTFSL